MSDVAFEFNAIEPFGADADHVSCCLKSDQIAEKSRRTQRTKTDIPAVFRPPAQASRTPLPRRATIRRPEPVARSERQNRRAVSGIAETLK